MDNLASSFQSGPAGEERCHTARMAKRGAAQDSREARRSSLTREVIVERAISYVDEHGLQQLTMRRLGESLGVEAMSLYHHINGREALLEAMVDRLVEQFRVDPLAPVGPADSWQGYVQELANSVRRLARQHPEVFPLVATRHPAAPWLRPPLRSLAVVEDFLEAMSRRGLGREETVYAYKVFTSFLLGHLLLEVAARGARTGPVEEPIDEGSASVPNQDQDVSLADYPLVASYRPLLTAHDPDAEFEKALEALLDRMDLQLSQ